LATLAQVEAGGIDHWGLYRAQFWPDCPSRPTPVLEQPALDRALQPKDDPFGARGARTWVPAFAGTTGGAWTAAVKW
jgi:hypothetical protein